MGQTVGIVYKATNQINGKVYIGITMDSVYARKRDHEQKANLAKCSHFQEAIRTYGPDAFTWEEIDTADTTNELAQKERQYILQYKSVEDGYNSDVGGGLKKTIYQYDLRTGVYQASYDSLDDAASAVSAARTSISNACLGYVRSCMGSYWSYEGLKLYPMAQDKRKKAVMQCTLTGILIAQYASVVQASRATGISKTCIARVCRGEREQSGGYRWYYFG